MLNPHSCIPDFDLLNLLFICLEKLEQGIFSRFPLLVLYGSRAKVLQHVLIVMAGRLFSKYGPAIICYLLYSSLGNLKVTLVERGAFVSLGSPDLT